MCKSIINLNCQFCRSPNRPRLKKARFLALFLWLPPQGTTSLPDHLFVNWEVYIVIFVISEDAVKIYTPKTLFDWTIIRESERHQPLPPLVITLHDCFRLRPLFIPEHKRLFPWTRFSTRDRHRALAWQHGHRGEKHPHTTSFLRQLCSLEAIL